MRTVVSGSVGAMTRGMDERIGGASRSDVGVWVSRHGLRIEVARAAAAAGVELHDPRPDTDIRSADAQSVVAMGGKGGSWTDPRGDVGSPRPTEGEWARLPVVVLEAESAAASARAGLPRRQGVLVVVGAGEAEADVLRSAVRLGAEEVLELPADAQSLLTALSRRGATGAGGGGVIAVIGGHGGAGASVLASALALTAPLPSLLVDLDPAGPGLDLLMGVERQEGLRWPDLRLHDGRVDSDALRRALPRTEETTVLASSYVDTGRHGADEPHSTVPRGLSTALPAMPSAIATRSVLSVGEDGGMTVVCDVSCQRTESAVAAIEAAELCVLVVRADVPSCASAVRAARWLSEHTADAGLVVRGPAPGGLRGADVESALGLPLLSAMSPEPGLAKRLEHGGVSFARRSPLAAASRTIHHLHARRPGAGAA